MVECASPPNLLCGTVVSPLPFPNEYHDSSEKTQDRQPIERIEPVLFHSHPLHPLNPLMAFGLFQ